MKVDIYFVESILDPNIIAEIKWNEGERETKEDNLKLISYKSTYKIASLAADPIILSSLGYPCASRACLVGRTPSR
jgi:hypothetical protein